MSETLLESPSLLAPGQNHLMPAYARYIGIDYSGAEMPTASLKGLRVFVAVGAALPVEVPPQSIGTGTGPPIGMQKGPLFSNVVAGLSR
jgi:hypothetical protein